MKYNTGLYIRRRGSNELWQLFLGGYTKAKPSALYDSYHKYFKELHEDYEWVVLERIRNSSGRCIMYRVGDSERVDVMIDALEPDWWWPDAYETKKEVECLSLWHMDSDNKTFIGSTTNRICPDCEEKEYKFLYYRGCE